MTKILTNKSNIDLDYPICRPSLDLDFTQEVLDPRITFTRGTSGTRVNRNRLIETMSINTPRFDYDPVTGECLGLLIEEPRTNLLTYSEQFDDASWGKVAGSISANSISSPDGTTTADAFIENTTSNAYHYFQKTITKVASSITYTLSVFVQSKGGRRIGLRLQSGSTGAVSAFDLVSGTITTVAGIYGTGFSSPSSSIIKYPNNWYRIILTVTSDAATSLIAEYYLQNGASSVYTGDGTSGIYIWGAQLEAGEFPTSYIPTDGTAGGKPRSVDDVSMTGTKFSSWYNQTEGTLLVDCSNPTSSTIICNISDGTVSNRLQLEGQTNNRQIRVVYNGVSTTSPIAYTYGRKQKFISSYTSNILRYANAGILGTTIKIPGFPTVNNLRIGASVTNVSQLNTSIARLTYYPRSLTDNQLKYLTA